MSSREVEIVVGDVQDIVGSARHLLQLYKDMAIRTSPVPRSTSLTSILKDAAKLCCQQREIWEHGQKDYNAEPGAHPGAYRAASRAAYCAVEQISTTSYSRFCISDALSLWEGTVMLH